MKISKTLEQSKKMVKTKFNDTHKGFAGGLAYLDDFVGKDITKGLDNIKIPYFNLSLRQKKLLLAFVLIFYVFLHEDYQLYL